MMNGNAALVRAAKCLSQQIYRPTDMLARYGGEEFMAILPDTSIKGALALAKKIRHAVYHLKFSKKRDALGTFLRIGCDFRV